MASKHGFQPFHRLFALLVFALSATALSAPANAKKIFSGVCGRVYLSSGDSIVTNDVMRITIPMKSDKVGIIENAYTSDNKIEKRIDPEAIDSVVLWPVTSPQRHHTFIFIKKYGWCFRAEHSPSISVYCFSPKGYGISGNGGLWLRGKGKMLVFKDGKEYDFGSPYKNLNKKIRATLENLVADDPQLLEYIKKAKGRRDKVLRSLVMYNPKQTTK